MFFYIFPPQTFKVSLEKAKNNEEKLIFIKATGNAGWISRDVFQAVVNEINDPKAPLHMKLHAIWALRHAARIMPLLVRKIFSQKLTFGVYQATSITTFFLHMFLRIF